MTQPDSPPIFTRYGFTRTGDAASPLEIRPYAETCVHGALRATVVASAIDLVGGFATRAAAGTDVTFTTDLSLRIARPGIPERILAYSHPLRAGRRLVTTGVHLESETGIYAYGETTFLRIARDTPAPDIEKLATPETIPFYPLARPLPEEIGIEPLASRPGCVRLTLNPTLLNPEGVLQGALVALIVESAALTLAEASRTKPSVVVELDLRYLAAASVGPVEATSTWIGSSHSGMIRVELFDRGREDRLTTSALVRVDDAPGR